MIRVLYVSKPAPGLSGDGIEAMMSPVRERALVHNAQHHLTGALAYSETCFAQALEGEEAVVESLMAKIATDSRHSDVQVIDRREVTNRAFPDWAMAFCPEEGFSAFGMQPRDLVRHLIEAAQHCNKVRAIPGFFPDADLKKAANG
jgi:hypothetical protein